MVRAHLSPPRRGKFFACRDFIFINFGVLITVRRLVNCRSFLFTCHACRLCKGSRAALLSANTSRCRARAGLSPYRRCVRRAQKRRPASASPAGVQSSTARFVTFIGSGQRFRSAFPHRGRNSLCPAAFSHRFPRRFAPPLSPPLFPLLCPAALHRRFVPRLAPALPPLCPRFVQTSGNRQAAIGEPRRKAASGADGRNFGHKKSAVQDFTPIRRHLSVFQNYHSKPSGLSGGTSVPFALARAVRRILTPCRPSRPIPPAASAFPSERR